MSQSRFNSSLAGRPGGGLDVEAFLTRIEDELARHGEPYPPAWPWALASFAAGAVLALGAILGAAAGSALGEALGGLIGACLT